MLMPTLGGAEQGLLGEMGGPRGWAYAAWVQVRLYLSHSLCDLK